MLKLHSRDAPAGEITTIGLDIATSASGAQADASGSVVLRRKPSRGRLLALFASPPSCLVAIEACAGSDHGGRVLARLGHTVRLIPPADVKPCLMRQWNDETDAEAICAAGTYRMMVA